MFYFQPRIPIALLALGSLPLSAKGTIDFNRDIRPILSDRCYKCHGPDAKNQKSDFRLDTREHAITDLGGYFGIVPRDLGKSDLHLLIRSDDKSEVMPPPESKMSLTDLEKDLLDRWILEGAQYDTHWSLKPLPAKIYVPENTAKASSPPPTSGATTIPAASPCGWPEVA